VDAIYYVPSNLVRTHLDLLIHKENRIPLSVTDDTTVERGTLVSYGADLQLLGYGEGKNVTFLVEDTHGTVPDLVQRAARLVATNPDVLVTVGTIHTTAARQATDRVPIVFTYVGDPLRSGLIASYASSKNNLTGVSVYSGPLSGKRLELLHEIAPGIKRILAVVAAKESIAESTFQTLDSNAAVLEIRVLATSRHLLGPFEQALSLREGEVADQRLEHIAWGYALFARVLQDQLEDMPHVGLIDSLCSWRQQAVMSDVIAGGLQVNVEDAGLLMHERCGHTLDGSMGAPLGAGAIRPLLEVGCQERLHNERESPWPHTGAHRRDRQDAHACAAALRDRLAPVPRGSVRAVDEFVAYLVAEGLHPCCCDRLQRHPVTLNRAWSASRSTHVHTPLNNPRPLAEDDLTEIEVTDPTHPLFGRRFPLHSARPQAPTATPVFVTYPGFMVLRLPRAVPNLLPPPPSP
jgi:hypothetical protein